MSEMALMSLRRLMEMPRFSMNSETIKVDGDTFYITETRTIEEALFDALVFFTSLQR